MRLKLDPAAPQGVSTESEDAVSFTGGSISNDTQLTHDPTSNFVLSDATSPMSVNTALNEFDDFLSSGPGSIMANYGQELISTRVAWANRTSTPINIWCIGDSYTAGLYATSRYKVWTSIFEKRLNEYLGIHGDSLGYISLNSNNFLVTDIWTFSGTNTPSSGTYGPGLFACIFDQNSYAETTQVCDRFYVFYPKSTGLSGQFKVTIDGVDVATGISNNGTTKNSYIWDSGQLSRGEHTIRITGTSANTSTATKATVEGVYFFDGNYEGARVINCGHSGYLTSQMFAGSSTSRTQYDGTRTGIMPATIVFIECGGNDIIFGVNVNTWRATLEAGIDEVREVADDYAPTIVLVPPHWTNNSQWAVFRQQMYQVAREKNCAVFDWYQTLGNILSTTLPAPVDASEDDLHLNDLGMNVLGNMMARLLLHGMPTSEAKDHSGHPIKPITADYTATYDDEEIVVDATDGAVNITLPTSYNHVGKRFTVRKIDNSVNAVTVVGTIDGAANYTLSSQYDRVTVSGSGTSTQYYILENN